MAENNVVLVVNNSYWNTAEIQRFIWTIQVSICMVFRLVPFFIFSPSFHCFIAFFMFHDLYYNFCCCVTCIHVIIKRRISGIEKIQSDTIFPSYKKSVKGKKLCKKRDSKNRTSTILWLLNILFCNACISNNMREKNPKHFFSSWSHWSEQHHISVHIHCVIFESAKCFCKWLYIVLHLYDCT